MKLPTETSEHSAEKCICYECHDCDRSVCVSCRSCRSCRIFTWYVHVWAIDVFSRREEVGFVAGALSLLPNPRLMSEREQDEEEFIDHVGVCNVEVVFDG